MLPSAPNTDVNAGLQIADIQRIFHGLLAELPGEAQAVLSRLHHEIEQAQAQTTAQTTQVQQQAQQQLIEIEQAAEYRRRAMLEEAIRQLEIVQLNLFRTGEHGKAVATVLQIQALRAQIDAVLPNPGNLREYEQIGKSYHFHVVGHTQGSLWGTDVYTSDSDLASAAVHAGALEEGEAAVVRVTVVDMSGQAIRGTSRNGVTSHDWPSYQVGYMIQRA